MFNIPQQSYSKAIHRTQDSEDRPGTKGKVDRNLGETSVTESNGRERDVRLVT